MILATIPVSTTNCNGYSLELMKLLGIDHLPIIPSQNFQFICLFYMTLYNYTGVNQTIQDMLTKFIEGKKYAWEDYLDTCVYAYNTAVHVSSP